MKDIVIAAVGISVVSALLLAMKKPASKENFFGLPPRTVKRDREVRVENKYGSAMYSIPPTYQGNISPRFSNVGYGSFIRYNIPDMNNLGVPADPLTFQSQDFPLTFQGNVMEGYSAPSQMRDLKQFAAAAQDGEFKTPVRPGVAEMESAEYGNEQIYNYDRLIYAQKKSRLNGLGDPIRGDLPITPIQGDWFRPSVDPNIDLREGALSVIAGHDNSTARELRALQSEYSGKTALAQKDISLGAGQADIFVTAFP